MPGKSDTHCFTSILPPSCQVVRYLLLHINSPTVMPGRSDTHCFTSSLPPSYHLSQISQTQLHIISPTVMPGKSDTHCFTSTLPPSCQVNQVLTASHQFSHLHARMNSEKAMSLHRNQDHKQHFTPELRAFPLPVSERALSMVTQFQTITNQSHHSPISMAIVSLAASRLCALCKPYSSGFDSEVIKPLTVPLYGGFDLTDLSADTVTQLGGFQFNTA
ncbi:hypothetical protein J6590_100857 [Homalodisca vitripennis]|nr:hypothetical protein J6590_100857 [Homalodisca vitripennis]